MSRVFGFLGVLIVCGVGLFIYKQQIQAVAPAGSANPVATVDIVGVRNDLIAIAGAERRHAATDGKFVSVDELISSHDLSMRSPSRGPYSYSADINGESFRIVATYSGPDQPGVPHTISVDQDMQVSQE